MRSLRLFAVFFSILPIAAIAQEAPNYSCMNGGLERRVVVIYETGVTVPCEVHYFKDVEAPGNSQVLWRALNEEGYCEAKASEFVARLEGWGWACSAATAPQASPAEATPGDEPDQAPDDTDALAPSEDPASSDPR